MSYPFIIFLLEKMPAKTAEVCVERTLAPLKSVSLYTSIRDPERIARGLGIGNCKMSPVKSR
jgi:hypothetical protein